MKAVVTFFSVLLGMLLLAGTSVAEHHPGVGLGSITLPDPVDGQSMQGMVFYPSGQPTGKTVVGSVAVDGLRDAPPEPGRHALIVLSHGNSGSMLGHHDLASSLARAGYIVAALTHPGDNFRDQDRVGTGEVFLGRPRQMSALISAVLADPTFGSLVDESRVGAAGFSMGGYTVLILAGAQPNFQLVDSYCAKPSALEFCANRKAIREIVAADGSLADKRVRAVVSMAPMDAFFDTFGLAKLRCPVLLIGAENDHLGLGLDNTPMFRDAMPPVSEYMLLPKAGHFVFLAPCSQGQAVALPQLCVDPEGVDRVGIHREINSRVIRFFDRTLQ